MIEHMAGMFRGHIVQRQKTCLKHLQNWVPGKTVVEIGCASGNTCFQLLKMGAKKVIGLDISPTAIAAARKASQTIESGKTAFYTHRIGDTFKPDSDSVDLLMGLGILEYVDPKDVCTLVSQVKPAGIFLSFDEKIYTFQKLLHFVYRKIKKIPYYKQYSQTEIRQVFTDLGFSDAVTFRDGKNAFIKQL